MRCHYVSWILGIAFRYCSNPMKDIAVIDALQDVLEHEGIPIVPEERCGCT
jgi:hypothetical protein